MKSSSEVSYDAVPHILASSVGVVLHCLLLQPFSILLLLLCCCACCCCCVAMLSLEIAAAAGLSFQSKLLFVCCINCLLIAAHSLLTTDIAIH
jgi:hypothetical protein